jgi:hypothetical protein
MESAKFSTFEIEPFTLLEGYINGYTPTTNCENITDNVRLKSCLESIQTNIEKIAIYGTATEKPLNRNISNAYYDLSNNMSIYNAKNVDVAKYDLIDNHGNLTFVNNTNFKETIPKLKDAVLEDTNNMMYYQNSMYVISGIAVAFLAIGAIIVAK